MPGDSSRPSGARNQIPRASKSPSGVGRSGTGPKFANPPDVSRVVRDHGVGYVCRDFVRKFSRREDPHIVVRKPQYRFSPPSLLNATSMKFPDFPTSYEIAALGCPSPNGDPNSCTPSPTVPKEGGETHRHPRNM